MFSDGVLAHNDMSYGFKRKEFREKGKVINSQQLKGWCLKQ